MKDAKTLSLLFFSLLLLLLACLILLLTWGYYKFYYNKDVDKKPQTEIVANKAAGVNDEYRDSLQELYTTTINNLNTSFDKTLKNVDTTNLSSELTPAAFYKLKNEIEEILKNDPLKEDLNLASEKISELQNKITELNNKNLSVENENKRLNGKLSQLANELRGVEHRIKNDKGEDIVDKKNNVSTFTVSQINISAVMIKDGREQETSQADQTDKLVGTFTVKNINQFNGVDLLVVVLQPGGRVMQGSAWESGSFDTRDGRKIYSTKLHFDYSAGESKRLSFSLSVDRYPNGEYTMQVFHNGIIIGKVVKTLV